MVYGGKPSRGCAVCRRRRIKCDEKPGSCSYCEKTRQICPGYKDDFDLAWRDQTVTARNQVNRRRKAQDQIGKAGTPDATLELDSVTSLRPLETSILFTPTEYLEDHALPFLCRNHIFIPRDYDSSTSFMESIPILYAKARQGSPLRFAANMIGMRMIEPWIDAKREYSRSRALYGKTLATVRDQIASAQDCWSDEFLLAILLLDMYEDLMNQKKGKRTETHIIGAVELVRRRPVETYQSATSKALLLAARNHLVGSCIRQKTRFPQWFLEILSKVPNFPDGYARKLFPMNMALAELQVDSEDLHQSLYDTDPSQLHELLGRALAIDARFSRWAAESPLHMVPVRVFGASIPDSVRAAGLYQDFAYVYLTITSGFVWTGYSMSRMRVHNVILTLLGTLTSLTALSDHTEPVPSDTGIPTALSLLPPLQQLRDISHAAIQSLADDICAALPYYLGDKTTHSTTTEDRNVAFPTVPGREIHESHYRATAAMGRWFLLGPFAFILSEVDELRDGQKDWIRSQMKRMNNIHGGKKAPPSS